ncbi:MAG: FliA/WhiG family RNA polymerase sigma factor [Planctomycetota bacterium]|nr:MAG: FliA/WhiG family RNA polymerase sigma factor [Planctomycetota bacterium]
MASTPSRTSGGKQSRTRTGASSSSKSSGKAGAPAAESADTHAAAPAPPPSGAKGKRAPKPGSKGRAKTGRSRGELGGENEALWRDYAKTHNPALRNTLMEMYLPVVHFTAERLLMTLPRSIELEDLKSAGIFGLMDAIDGFDIDRGIKFKTYCSTRVRGAILDELRSQDWVPRLVRLRAHQINRAQASLEAAHGRLPTDNEMAEALDLPVHDYLSMVEEARAHTVRSLSESWDDGSGDQAMEKIDYLRDPGAPDPAEIMNQKDVMKTMIRSLNKREKEIILMYYRDGLTMKQIGRLMSLTESRVCQIHSNVMKKLKLHLEDTRENLAL